MTVARLISVPLSFSHHTAPQPEVAAPPAFQALLLSPEAEEGQARTSLFQQTLVRQSECMQMFCRKIGVSLLKTGGLHQL